MIGPRDAGRRMTLDEFDLAEGQPGYLYELHKGVVSVMDVPSPRPLIQIHSTRRQFAAYDLQKPGTIHTIAGSMECKLLLAESESERHPDLAIYKTPPPEEDVWSVWVPELVVEVVSPGSEQRDYTDKPEEYLDFGVSEYWIIDSFKQQMLVLYRSRGRFAEKVVRPGDPHTTRLLPTFQFDLAAVFSAIG
jgi:Uma2 family endonuclease